MRLIKKLCFIFIIALCFSLCVLGAQEKQVRVFLDGEEIDCESYGQSAVIVESRTLVPLRSIFEALGASVTWDSAERKVTSEREGIVVSLKIGEDRLIKNGNEIKIDVPAMIMNNRTVVPVRAVSEAFGVEVEWDAKSRTVLLYSSAYRRGTNDGKTYESSWLGLKYTLPEGAEFFDDRTIRHIMGLAEDKMLEELDEDKVLSLYEFAASDNGSVMLYSEKVNGRTLEEFLKYSTADAYEKSGMKYELSSQHETRIAEMTFTAVDAKLYAGETELFATTAVMQKDDRFVVIAFIFPDSEKIKLHRNAFSHIE